MNKEIVYINLAGLEYPRDPSHQLTVEDGLYDVFTCYEWASRQTPGTTKDYEYWLVPLK